MGKDASSGQSTKVTCYKGTQTGDKKTYNLNVESTLDKIRDKLTSDGFMPLDQGDTIAYRFVNSQSTSTKFEEAVVGRDYERYIPLKNVVGTASQLVLTNIHASNKPDLLGINSTSFFNRHIAVSISLNNEDPKARETNAKLKAFAPLMLSNVQPTSTNVNAHFENVCVCVDGSVVSFTISSWGAAGFEISIASKADSIVKEMYHMLGNSPNRDDATTFRRYSDKEQTIKIVGLSQLNIAKNLLVNYQQVTFKTRRMTAYSSDGHNYQSNQSPPSLESRLERNRLLAMTQNRMIVPGDGITPGTTMRGPHSEQKFGTLSNIKVDDWTQALGEVNVYFFVFKSLEQAKKIIYGYNALDPDLWS